MDRAPSLARRIVEGVMQRYSERMQTALQALHACGPMQPCMELVIKVRMPNRAVQLPGVVCLVAGLDLLMQHCLSYSLATTMLLSCFVPQYEFMMQSSDQATFFAKHLKLTALFIS